MITLHKTKVIIVAFCV